MPYLATLVISLIVTVGTLFGYNATHPSLENAGASQTISALTELTSLSNNDVLPITDTANNQTKKLKWGTATATMKTVFDPLYSPIFSTSAGLAGLLSDETGSSGGFVRAGSPTISSPTLTTPVINVGSDATGDLYYRNAGVYTRLPIGSSGQYLMASSTGLPEYDNTHLLTNPMNSDAVFNATATMATTSISNLIGRNFGGTGVDGALVVTSGTTTINLGNAAVVEKNYTSISVTGTGALEFSNPATNGSIVILRSQGDFIHTSSKQIYLVGIGSAGGAGGSGGSPGDNAQDSGDGGGGGASMTAAGSAGQNSANGDSSDTDGTNGSAFSKWLYSQTAITGGGGGSGTGGAVSISPLLDTTYTKTYLRWFVLPGSGGGGGEEGSTALNVVKDGSTGGRGGGALYVEVGGSLNITGTINANGTNSTSTVDALGGCGGGGGGGSIQILYNNLVANSGTYSVAGGSGSGGTCTYAGGTGATGYSSVVQNKNF